MSFVFGFACAHGGAALSNKSNIKKDTTITCPMHQSTAIDSITLDAMTGDTLVAFTTNDASQTCVDRDMVTYEYTEPSAPLEENKGDPPTFINTS